ncbi:biotin carboxyl carrier protein of methylmalonyl-CoA:pyruvate transcarboxylase [Cutibacterium acnes JCM 18918]|nr:biotin carboxyl carrier protein of methylmalonyl-CoA:pyruvate transcarboxylase [Cutibacterium acnes JCM 18918]
MKLKVTVNDVAYDVDVDVDKTANAPMAPILFGGGAGGPMKHPVAAPVRPVRARFPHR